MLDLVAEACEPIYPFRYWCLPDKEKEVPDNPSENPSLPEDKDVLADKENVTMSTMSTTRQPEIIQVIVGCTEIPKVEVEVEIPRIQIEIPKLNVGGGKAGIKISPSTPTDKPTLKPTDKPTLKPTSFGGEGDTSNGIRLVSAETPLDEGQILDNLLLPFPADEPLILDDLLLPFPADELPMTDDGGGVWV